MKVQFSHENHPAELLTPEEIDAIQAALDDLIFNEGEAGAAIRI